MRLGRLYLVVLACGLGFAARAEDVSIDALGGVISNNASAFYMISSANGAGQNVGLQGGVDKVTISGLEQRQNKVDAIVRMAAGEVLSLGSLAIGSDIVKGLWIGDAEKTGELKPRGKKIIANTPTHKFGEPEDLVGTMLYLLSDISSFVTGVVIPVDGGYSAFGGV